MIEIDLSDEATMEEALHKASRAVVAEFGQRP